MRCQMAAIYGGYEIDGIMLRCFALFRDHCRRACTGTSEGPTRS